MYDGPCIRAISLHCMHRHPGPCCRPPGNPPMFKAACTGRKHRDLDQTSLQVADNLTTPYACFLVPDFEEKEMDWDIASDVGAAEFLDSERGEIVSALWRFIDFDPT